LDCRQLLLPKSVDRSPLFLLGLVELALLFSRTRKIPIRSRSSLVGLESSARSRL
jgi:hypothetical protein